MNSLLVWACVTAAAFAQAAQVAEGAGLDMVCPQEYISAARDAVGTYVGDGYLMEIKEHACVSLSGDLGDPKRGGEFQIRFVASLDSDNGAYAAAASYSVNCFPSPFGQVCVTVSNLPIGFVDALGVTVFTLEEFPNFGAPNEYDIKAAKGARLRLERPSFF